MLTDEKGFVILIGQTETVCPNNDCGRPLKPVGDRKDFMECDHGHVFRVTHQVTEGGKKDEKRKG